MASGEARAVNGNDEKNELIRKLMSMIQAPDFPGKLMPEHISQYEVKLVAFNDVELTAVIEKIEEEIDKKKTAGKTLLISKIEDITALTKMEVMLETKLVPEPVINMLLSLLVNKSSNFAIPIFEGKLNELFDNSIEHAIFNIVLEKAVAEKSSDSSHSKGLKELFDRKIRDTETFIHLIQIIDAIDLNGDVKTKSVFTLNLLAEAMKRDETMRKSESINMKDLVNIYLLSKLQMQLAEYGYPNETLEGIMINRLGQSNNIRRQFRILDRIIKDTLSGELNIELGSKTEKLEWLKLMNELEVEIALEQYEEKLKKDRFEPVADKDKVAIRQTLMSDNIADQTIAAISFARRLDNPDESIHEPGKLIEIAIETQYLTSMIFKVKGFQIKEVYEFVELIGELDVKNEHYQRVVEYFKSELPFIDKGVMKEEDPDIKKAALSARYLSARLMSKFQIDPAYLKLSTDHVGVDYTKLAPELKSQEQELQQRVAYFNEVRKRLAFFNKAERAFLTMNQVESLIDKDGMELNKTGVFKILESVNDIELNLAINEYVKAGTITKGPDDGVNFSPEYVEQKVKALFKTASIQVIEKEAVEKNIIPESILDRAKEDGDFEETVLDIKNYATYLLTRRLDKPEYPRHLQRSLNLIFALIQDAIGWRHFENSQIRAKQEVVPLIDEYHRFMSKLLDALAEDKDAAHEEIISKLRDDDFFAIVDNKDSLEGGKKSAPQVRSEFIALMNDDRFQQYLAKATGYAEHSTVDDWGKFYAEQNVLKNELKTNMAKTGAVIENIVKDLRTDTKNSEKYKDYIATLENRYLDQIKRMEYHLSTNKKPPGIVKIEYDRVANSEKFKVFLKHTFELTKSKG